MGSISCCHCEPLIIWQTTGDIQLDLTLSLRHGILNQFAVAYANRCENAVFSEDADLSSAFMLQPPNVRDPSSSSARMESALTAPKYATLSRTARTDQMSPRKSVVRGVFFNTQ